MENSVDNSCKHVLSYVLLSQMEGNTMKKFLLTAILAVAMTPIIYYNMYKYRTRQRETFEQH